MIGIGSGGITGAGLGEGVQKVLYLPEAHTDMIFAVVGEELGLVGAVLVIGAFATFAFAGFRIALRCRDPFGKLLAAGLTALVCGQAAINLAAVLGIATLLDPAPVRLVRRLQTSSSSSPGSAISLTSPSMERSSRLACVIAAGGTAGHVRPALAVAEALVAPEA